jgi:hypothetical protein
MNSMLDDMQNWVCAGRSDVRILSKIPCTYWSDVGPTKRDLAEYVKKWIWTSTFTNSVRRKMRGRVDPRLGHIWIGCEIPVLVHESANKTASGEMSQGFLDGT